MSYGRSLHCVALVSQTANLQVNNHILYNTRPPQLHCGVFNPEYSPLTSPRVCVSPDHSYLQAFTQGCCKLFYSDTHGDTQKSSCEKLPPSTCKAWWGLLTPKLSAGVWYVLFMQHLLSSYTGHLSIKLNPLSSELEKQALIILLKTNKQMAIQYTYLAFCRSLINYPKATSQEQRNTSGVSLKCYGVLLTSVSASCLYKTRRLRC